jgi:hypothetical protein
MDKVLMVCHCEEESKMLIETKMQKIAISFHIDGIL